MSEAKARNILVLGASGLIGRFVTDDLRARGFAVIGVARQFSAGQRTSPQDVELPLLSLGEGELARLVGDRSINVVVNCLGVLQDGPGSDTAAVHRDFVGRLLTAISQSGRAVRLIHISIPGAASDDCTAFSQTKREAERLIAASGIAYAILRPGFVVAPSAYGGSAMLRTLAALADFAAKLGWMSPMRSTAIAELRSGVAGDPQPWIQATGIVPKTVAEMIGQRPASIQDKWFARLFLVKALVIASLVVFWCVSGFIALFVSYDAAASILSSHRFPPWLVDPITIGTSLMDMGIGALIAFRRTCGIGLVAGITASLGYMFGAAILTPDLWIEPLGALVKTGPAIVLMLVALLILDNR
jgi:uncharacterized protein YbjT (DUF2867 family)